MEYLEECRGYMPERNPDKDICYKENPYDPPQREREVTRLLQEQGKEISALSASLSELQCRLGPILEEDNPQPATRGEVERDLRTELAIHIRANTHQVAICTAWVKNVIERLGI